jgi:hypothetical protein
MKKLLSRFICFLLVGKTYQNTAEFDFINAYLRKQGYSVYGDVYTKGFVVVEIKRIGKEIKSIDIFVDKVSKQKQTIEENFITGVIIAENYFKRV